MSVETYAEYVGLTAEAIALIERVRQSPSESKSAIIIRALSPAAKPLPESSYDDSHWFDYKEGIRIREGEPLLLFLSNTPKKVQHADARAVIKKDGFYLNSENIGHSDKRQFTPAMKRVQASKNDYNRKGELHSLSALRQWHVIRDGQLRSIEEIKDPDLARKRNVLSPVERKRQMDELSGLLGI